MADAVRFIREHARHAGWWKAPRQREGYSTGQKSTPISPKPLNQSQPDSIVVAQVQSRFASTASIPASLFPEVQTL